MQAVEQIASFLKRILGVPSDIIVRQARPAYKRMQTPLYGKTGIIGDLAAGRSLRLPPACQSIARAPEPVVMNALRSTAQLSPLSTHGQGRSEAKSSGQHR